MTKRAVITNPRMKVKTIRRSLRLGDNCSLVTRMHNVMWCLHHGLYCDIKHLRNLTIPHYVN